jgi:ABC-type multidrug transport system ATPase subunit
MLILDEPASGLDPAEVRTLRQRLRALAENGAAVLISSHQLAEVQQLATHAVIMNRGTLVAEGGLDALLSDSGTTSLGGAVRSHRDRRAGRRYRLSGSHHRGSRRCVSGRTAETRPGRLTIRTTLPVYYV